MCERPTLHAQILRRRFFCARCGELLGHKSVGRILPLGARQPKAGVARVRCPSCLFTARYFPITAAPKLAA
jgi:RNase P subunit RPR2